MSTKKSCYLSLFHNGISPTKRLNDRALRNGFLVLLLYVGKWPSVLAVYPDIILLAGPHVIHLNIQTFNSKRHILTEVHAKTTPYVIEASSFLACMRAHPVPWPWNSFTLTPSPYCGLPSSLATFHNSLKTSSNPIKSASDRASLYCTAHACLGFISEQETDSHCYKTSSTQHWWCSLTAWSGTFPNDLMNPLRSIHSKTETK